MPLKLIAHLATASKFNWLSGHRTQLICLCLSLSVFEVGILHFKVWCATLFFALVYEILFKLHLGVSRDDTSYIFTIPCLLFVWVKLTMSCAHKWSTGDNMSCHCLSNRSNIKRQSSQAARHNAHCTLSSLKYSPSHFLSQVHTLSDKQLPRLKTFRPPKKRHLLSSLWLVAQSTLCSYPALPPSSTRRTA